MIASPASALGAAPGLPDGAQHTQGHCATSLTCFRLSPCCSICPHTPARAPLPLRPSAPAAPQERTGLGCPGLTARCPPRADRVAQNVVKSHLETCQYTTEELKRLAWSLYSPEEVRALQSKVSAAVTAPCHSQCPLGLRRAGDEGEEGEEGLSVLWELPRGGVWGGSSHPRCPDATIPHGWHSTGVSSLPQGVTEPGCRGASTP